MKREITLTIEQLKAIFIAGEEFEKQNIEFDMGERDEIDALDFGDFIKETFNIELKD
jgi:hypothetical protein